MLSVTEIFRSIQGESSWAGWPCVFVRLSGCNLRCHYCDTRYAYEPGTRLTIAAIVDRVLALGNGLTEVTGGEPLCQEQTPDLLLALARSCRTVLLETNGSLPLPRLRPYRTILDLKCPSSGESSRMDWGNVVRLQPGDEIKFVIGDADDFAWAVAQIRTHQLDRHQGVALLFSPVADKLAPAELARWMLDGGLNVRLQLQLHRMLWPDRERGV
jgi:7-carboxy-7-deazaguanine synthase